MRPDLPLLLTICLVLSGSRGFAEVPVEAQAKVDAAFQDVEALAKRTRENGTMPQWSDAAGHAALAKMWDAPAILGAPPYSAKDMPALLAITPKEGSLLKSYVLFSPKAGSPPDFAANAKTYESEIARASAFMIHINAVVLPAITDYMVHLKPAQLTQMRLQGMRQMRLGMLQEVTGAATMIRSGELNPENQAIIVDALTDSGEALAAASPPADRDVVVKTVEPMLAMLTADEKSRMQAFVKAMQRSDCSGLCALK